VESLKRGERVNKKCNYSEHPITGLVQYSNGPVFEWLVYFGMHLVLTIGKPDNLSFFPIHSYGL
jgi:hypothetical protein